jgi:hypothetical protein
MYKSPPTSLSIAALPAELVFMLIEAALDSASRAADARRKRRTPKRGLTLQPGPDTPLWNELVRQVQPHLRKRGAKNQLGRILGVSRQRIYVCLKTGQAALDAERTLRLLGWLAARHLGPQSPAAARVEVV